MLIKAKIDFKMPNHKQMEKAGFTSIDMHYHTKYSDGMRKVPIIIKKAKRLGIGVSITDHNDIRGALEINKCKDILSIPGIEVTSKEGVHTLFYFYNASELAEFYNYVILPNKEKNSHFTSIPLNELLENSKDFNCIIVAAHPHGVGRTSLCNDYNRDTNSNKILSYYDGIEVINGVNLRQMNRKSIPIAEKNNNMITGGSDGHTLFELGNCLTYLKYQADRNDFLDGIKKCQNFVMGKETNMIEKAMTLSTKLTLPIKHPIDYAKIGYDFTKNYIKIK